MDDLSRRMRAAVATAPPSRVDVEELIATDARRRRQRAWTVAATGVAAAVAAVLVAPSLLTVSAGGSEPATVGPPPASRAAAAPMLCSVAEGTVGGDPPDDTLRERPTEQPETGTVRLTVALREALNAELPAGVGVYGVLPDCDVVQFRYQPDHREYEAAARLTQGGQVNNLVVTVRQTVADEQTTCGADAAPEAGTCESEQFPDVGVISSGSTTVDRDTGAEQRWASLLRVDGTTVTVTTNNFHIERPGGSRPTTTAESPLLTVDQLVRLVRTPGLTLYP